MASEHPTAPQPLYVLCLLALAVGVVGGIAAWLFRQLIGLVHNLLFLGTPAFHYDTNLHTAASPWGMGVILVPVVGGLLVAWLVKTFAPEAKGHGVPEVMDAIYFKQGIIRPRVALVKSLASAISIGSGAAVGREGPIIQIGSAFGSMLGQFIQMPARQRITLIAAGSGAGIAATFNAPLGGLVFAIELLLISINTTSVLLVGIATVTATHIGQLLLGDAPSFAIPQLQLAVTQPDPATGLVTLIVLGLMMGLVSVVFIRGLYWMEDRFGALPGNYYSRHALGMLCVGLMIYLLMHYTGHYYVQGVGYATIVDILSGLLSDPAFLFLLFALKLLATCLSLGSGASGGVFSPALFMGATIGAAFGQIVITLIPGIGIEVPAFAIAGMAAAIGGSTGAVLTGIIMLSEMTADYSIVVPLIIVTVTAAAVRKGLMPESIYTMKLYRRGEAVPEGLQAAVTAVKQVKDFMRTDITVSEAAAARKATNNWQLLDDGTVRTASHNTPSKYIVAAKNDNFADAVRRMLEAQASVILVARANSGPLTAAAVCGVLGQSEIARHTEELATLL